MSDEWRVAELEALTDPCPEADIWHQFPNDPYMECLTCGGVGRVAKQPETERIEIRSPDFFYLANVESGGGVYEANRDESTQEVVALTMVAGSGSWEQGESEAPA